MSSPNGITSQLGHLNITGVGDFGFTKCEPHRTFVNADTTITQNNYEQFTPIVRGMTIEVTVPMARSWADWIDSVFDTASFGGEGNTISPEPPDAVECNVASNPGGLETYNGNYLLDDHRVVYDSKDAARVIFTLRATGSFTVGY